MNNIIKHMKKEFIVSKIEMDGRLEDNCPYVCVTLTDTKGNFYPSRRQRRFTENIFGVTAVPMTSLDDLKNLPKKISDLIERAFRGEGNNDESQESTTIRLGSDEFKELRIKKGDKLVLEFRISNNDIQI